MQRLFRLYQSFIGRQASTMPSASNFPEEALDLSAEQGFGYFLARPGLVLNGRYHILRKLGKGQYSSTWLVSDSQSQELPKYYAVKILTAHATTHHRLGHLLELETTNSIKQLQGINKLPYLYDHFETEGPNGQHLCLVLNVLSTDVSRFRRSAPTKRLSFAQVKVIVVQVVEALAVLHAAHIVHTDVKPDNVLFDEGIDPESIQEFLNDNPLSIDGEFELHGVRYPIIRSQPIPHPFSWDDPPSEVELYSVSLTDFGHAQRVDKEPTTQTIGAYALRPPEVILEANFDTKVDIWSLGCMTFELLTGRWLFSPESGTTWHREDDHLAKMMEVTGETFNEKVLSMCRKRNEYFDKEGGLRRIDQMFPVPLEQAMMNYGLPESEVGPAASFIRACLHLNPEERSSARELEIHPWLANAYMCC
ncbi:kinase-like protein [Gymnopilus junonius]|uniref:non-specific serine/threonine protein kinase n=1 Tax=Gymnopilus junonius TaxID=109634 RepID=A0A9P5TP63_GYMJU|nr:kinase-like protein [Gymnopilus junonius]